MRLFAACGSLWGIGNPELRAALRFSCAMDVILYTLALVGFVLVLCAKPR